MHVYPRIIPVLLLEGERLVKTREFGDARYVGDPVNVISIFNDLEVDELMILDISGARSRVPSSMELLRRISSEAFIPLAYGGGVETVEHAERIISAGFEKIVVNTALTRDPDAVREMVSALGSQAIVGAVDVRLTATGYVPYDKAGTVRAGLDLSEWVARAHEVGVGEIMVTAIDREGTRQGIDLELVRDVVESSTVPVIAHGGAGTREDLVAPIEHSGASAVAAGSAFVMQAGRDSVLINYPTRPQIDTLFAHLAEGRNDQAASAALTHDIDIEAAEDFLSSPRVCARCIITSDVPGAAFDPQGVCYYCHLHDSLDRQYPIGPESERALDRFVGELKAAGDGKQYDCIMGVSGGTDSSYLAHLLVSKGVRPLAVHFDNTWNSPTATSNIFAVLEKLGVELETYVVDNAEYDDIYRSFMLAGVKDIEAPTDIGFMGVLYRAAEKHGIRHIVEGHSFRTEGISPMGWLYMDGGYIKGVHRKFGRLPMKTFPNLDFGKFVRWSAFSRIQRTRPLYWIDYNKEDAKKFLAEQFGWKWYGGHHLENRFTAFYHTYFLPTRFGINFRQIELSALVRSGQMDRRVAAAQFIEPRFGDPELIAMVKKRLGFTDAEFEHVMTMPRKDYTDYSTYKRRFELLRPFFWLMWKLNRVPKSFYVKFCVPRRAA
ncbi:N-acetyl sugar amidotransferase [Microbacterium sp. zg.B48]|uniref:N-acetyl sugar amidotransferase n=1 Tax=unclassified Microbacterium TaxID=2609290 RepID=UPI00214BD972|nr:MULTISPECIES: N-acetyl sugar amidotransferase [unclassified Microbacterium]MCR2765135.1 N-acetyl sugar amidotransferase [Microbacterium sp. zg.B48]MCR2810264.1 N-acetyl sugar amidotransferase [Microbacterium sp. zg.B185]WIM19907.1 N-acetyl sugar amidotransferase [Microbacterium sp. zg-B185]